MIAIQVRGAGMVPTGFIQQCHKGSAGTEIKFYTKKYFPMGCHTSALENLSVVLKRANSPANHISTNTTSPRDTGMQYMCHEKIPSKISTGGRGVPHLWWFTRAYRPWFIDADDEEVAQAPRHL